MAKVKTKKRVKTKKKTKKVVKERKATKTKKVVGVIKSILQIVLKFGSISKADILKKLEKLFPDRPKDGMRRTIGVQVPHRLARPTHGFR